MSVYYLDLTHDLCYLQFSSANEYPKFVWKLVEWYSDISMWEFVSFPGQYGIVEMTVFLTNHLLIITYRLSIGLRLPSIYGHHSIM